MLNELLKSLSIDDIEKLLEVVYREGRSDGWNENSIDNGYDGKCRDGFSELVNEIIKEPKKFLI